MRKQMTNIDPTEIAKFSDAAAHWWDLQGEMKLLHEMNPLRLKFIDDRAHLSGKKVIDIGCGGGILTESMAKLGAHVTGVDMSLPALNVAKLHLHESQLQVEYVHTTAEQIAAERSEQYDVVTCLEMLEHVPDPQSIVRACATLLKKDGTIFFSTINRNIKAYLFAIIGAEYILKLLPKQTHDFSKFIRPSELANWTREAGLTLQQMQGIHYNPLTKNFSLNDDVSVNYLVCLKK
jgi:2-polyprenyl-6-hydroxyphenyl methylase/3-demethylubiquinone-9 3-methyltransferase